MAISKITIKNKETNNPVNVAGVILINILLLVTVCFTGYTYVYSNNLGVFLITWRSMFYLFSYKAINYSIPFIP